jgi:hypothetical protein
MCASPPSPRHAQPDWMGGGLVPRQMTQAPASEAISESIKRRHRTLPAFEDYRGANLMGQTLSNLMGMIPHPAVYNGGGGWTPDPRRIGDGTPIVSLIPIPGPIRVGDGDGTGIGVSAPWCESPAAGRDHGVARCDRK